MNQVRPFDQSKAETVKNGCLRNVRLGYGIPAKYQTAWEAWLHTEQHKDRNPPQGLDVPLYYSYTTTINGVRKNFGHINVRLANGKVWSDGDIFSSISAYENTHSPVYVGWGESINGVKVIGGDNMGEIEDLKKALETERRINRLRETWLTQLANDLGDDADAVEQDDIDRMRARIRHLVAVEAGGGSNPKAEALLKAVKEAVS